MAENILLPADELAQQENNGFGPLFKRRGRTAAVTSAIMVVISGATLFFAVKVKEESHFLVFTTTLLTLSVVLGELLRRLSLVSEEFKHKHTRYQGKWKGVFNAIFPYKYRKRTLVAVAASVLILCYQLYKRYEVFFRTDFAILFSLNCFVVPQLLFLVGLRKLSPVEIADLNEKGNKNVADGLAWSYYFGYLKLVLPKLEEQISKSELFRYEITRKKLFILLPKTCFLYDDIVDADPRVKWVGNLPHIERGMDGNRGIFKHAVYKIEMPRPDGTVEEYHFILEYATPLMALYDMSQHADAHFNREEREHQVG